MHPVIVFDLISFLASLTALIILLNGWKRAMVRDAKLLFIGLLAFTLVYSFCLFLEWSGITKALDPFEDFIGALVPMWWAFVFYFFLQEMAGHDLRQSEEKYRTILESIEDGYFEVDLAGNFTFFNDSICEILGYSRDELIGMNNRQYTDEDNARKLYQTFNKVYTSGQSAKEFDWQIIRKDGTNRHVDASVSLIKDSEDHRIGFRGIVREITERKRMEGALRESEEKYRKLYNESKRAEQVYHSLLQTSADAVIIYDMEGKVKYINPSFTKIFGWPMEELEGKRIPFLPDSEKEATMAGIKEIVGIGKAIQGFDTKRYTKDGRVIDVNISGSRYDDHEGKPAGMLVVLRDTSERKRLEAQLLQAQKMEAIGTLAGGVAHDLNNILSGIVSYPDLLLMQLPEDSPFKEPISTIQDSGNKAATIVQDLLTLARRGVATMEVVNLNDIISKYLKSPEYKKLLSFHPLVKVNTDLVEDLLNISGSPVHFTKTVMNLVSNAAEAMPDGGTILISTENRYIDSPIKGYDDIKEGDYITLKVSDYGIGISSKDRERIFEPFYTKKVMGRSGTGLGMAVVWGTVKDHQGYIDVQSTEGKGTTFILYFPATREKSATDQAAFRIEEYMSHGESILVVDDVEEQRKIASNILSELGYSVTSVSSGEKAVEYLQDNSADLLVLDMIMDPGIDGFETYKRIIQFHPDQKAIIASGFSETECVKEAQKLGAGQYVQKPYTLEKIGVAIKEELEK
ncbi:MAG: PAS domain S-box protein [Desulfobacteraceae bacterium]|nr:PAS domain S-box protein [Desulfobacteraceae bacterium]